MALLRLAVFVVIANVVLMHSFGQSVKKDVDADYDMLHDNSTGAHCAPNDHSETAFADNTRITDNLTIVDDSIRMIYSAGYGDGHQVADHLCAWSLRTTVADKCVSVKMVACDLGASTLTIIADGQHMQGVHHV